MRIPTSNLTFWFLESSVRLSDVKGADVLLAVEVANSSLRYDLDRKPRIYADIGVRELWVIDVASRIVHRHAEPTSQGYAQIVRCAGADLMTPLHAPAEFAFALDALEPL